MNKKIEWDFIIKLHKIYLIRLGYGSDFHAPGINVKGMGDYMCSHNVLKAHATVYHLYKKTFAQRLNGQIGITLDAFFYYSDTNDAVADRAMQFFVS